MKKEIKNGYNISIGGFSGDVNYTCPFCGGNEYMDESDLEDYGYDWDDDEHDITIPATCCDKTKEIKLTWESNDVDEDDDCPFEDGDYLGDGVYWNE